MYTGLNRGKNPVGMINRALVWLDRMPLGWTGIVMGIVFFVPILVLKEGCVFGVHDQLDETILSYVLNAKYPGAGAKEYPELLGGINRTGMQPSAVLFVPLYAVFSPLTAFLIQYAVVLLSAFFGMYSSVKRVTGSSILAVVSAGCFAALPLPPVYGLSAAGVPLLFYAFLCLYDRKHIVRGYLLLLFFGLTSHPVLIGYVVLGIWACYLVFLFLTKQKKCHVIAGFFVLSAVYVLANLELFLEQLFGDGSYVGHRTEMVSGSSEFGTAVRELFLHSGQHAPSLHEKLILPLLVLLLLEAWSVRKRDRKEKQLYAAALAVFAGIFAIAVFYGICQSDCVTAWKNAQTGFLHYFQLDRFYWLYPSLWYFFLALVFRVLWGGKGIEREEREQEKNPVRLRFVNLLRLPVVRVLVLLPVLYPTLQEIKEESILYQNVNQLNNGSVITGYISWESFYAEELMTQLEEAIGKEMSAYRVAHLGISPAPSLMHGFYTVDGYSNNYPLEYKHRFRKVMEKELEKSPETAVYFDTWGSRCYLFNSITGNYYMLKKGNTVTYENLDFDMEQLKELGCEYLFSGAEIADASRMGLEFMGYYETESSYWGIWLYRLL